MFVQVHFFFFLRKDELRETRTEKQRGKEGPLAPQQPPPPTPKEPIPTEWQVSAINSHINSHEMSRQSTPHHHTVKWLKRLK